MGSWVRRIRGAFGMGITWAIGWASVGMGIELVHNIWPNPIGGMVDIWPAVLAYPAFVGGLAFSTVLGIAGRRRRFDELSVGGFALWGLLGGLLLGLLPIGLAVTGTLPMVEAAILVGAISLLTTASASGSLLLAKMAEGGESVRGGEGIDSIGLTPEETRRLLGD
jgi:hypothetical protein